MKPRILSEKIINFCNIVEPFAFYGFIFFVPISIALSETFASFTLFFFFVKRWTIFITSSRSLLQNKVSSARKKAKELALEFCRIVKPEKSVLSRPLGLFIFACGISVLFSQYPILSLQGFFFKVLQWTYLYFVFIEFMRKKKYLLLFIGIFCVSAGIVFANGIFQYFNGKDFIFGEAYVDRLFSSFRHPNDFGAYLLLICPAILSLIFFLFISTKKKYPDKNIYIVFLFVLFLAGCFCLGMTFSRGAWFGFSFAMFFLATAFFHRQSKIALAPIGIVILFFLIFLQPLQHVRKISLISHTQTGSAEIVKKVFNSDFLDVTQKVVNESDRFIYWKPAAQNILRFPILGSGVNTYTKIAEKNPEGTGGYPHNCYLQMAAEIGLFGLGIFLWALFVLFRFSLRNFWEMTDSFVAAAMIGFLAGLFGFLVHSVFDTNFYSVQLGNLMWVVIGVIVMAQKIVFDQKERQS